MTGYYPNKIICRGFIAKKEVDSAHSVSTSFCSYLEKYIFLWYNFEYFNERENGVNLKNPENRHSLVRKKDEVLKQLDTMVTDFITETNGDEYKKGANLVYWLDQYIDYIKQREYFQSRRLIKYERGQIIKVNLGFNVGREEGGLRYAVVLDNNNSQASDVVTVVPLTSVKFNSKGEIINCHAKYDVLLGGDLYKSVIDKNKKQIHDLSRDLSSMTARIQKMKGVYGMYASVVYSRIVKKNKYLRYRGNPSSVDLNLKYTPLARQRATREKILKITNTALLRECYIQELRDILKQKRIFDEKLYLARKTSDEMVKMNKGTIALVGQITTVSKQRIYNPRYLSDALANVRISREKMDEITEKIKKLYIF